MSHVKYLKHHGVKGQKWGVRRYQNADGTLTAEGYKKLDRERKHEYMLAESREDFRKRKHSEKMHKPTPEYLRKQSEYAAETEAKQKRTTEELKRNAEKLERTYDYLNRTGVDYGKLPYRDVSSRLNSMPAPRELVDTVRTMSRSEQYRKSVKEARSIGESAVHHITHETEQSSKAVTSVVNSTVNSEQAKPAISSGRKAVEDVLKSIASTPVSNDEYKVMLAKTYMR